ncbi:MAG: DUF3784 domain-containing protein [Candidatus Woesearchaeota archaeon]
MQAYMVNILTGLFLILLGISIRLFNLSWLIAGYNTASKKEKAKYDEKKLISLVSNMIIISSLFIIIGGLIPVFYPSLEKESMIWSWVLYTVFILAGVVYMNVTDVVKKKPKNNS